MSGSPLPEEAFLKGPRPRRVLVFAELSKDTRAQLKDLYATTTDAESGLGTVALLADRDFDAAIFDMSLSAEIVARLKAGVGEIEGVPQELAERARARSRLMPFFLVNDDVREFTVVVDPPEHSYVEKTLGLAYAVSALDVAKLVMQGAARA